MVECSAPFLNGCFLNQDACDVLPKIAKPSD